MAETARIHRVGPPHAQPGPWLEVVRGTGDDVEASTAKAEPNAGRSGMVGYVIGFVAAAVVITVGGTLGGLGFGASLGLGLFVGLWGGGGFGFMLGATIPLARHLDAQSARSTDHGQGDIDGTAAR